MQLLLEYEANVHRQCSDIALYSWCSVFRFIPKIPSNKRERMEVLFWFVTLIEDLQISLYSDPKMCSKLLALGLVSMLLFPAFHALHNTYCIDIWLRTSRIPSSLNQENNSNISLLLDPFVTIIVISDKTVYKSVSPIS